MSENRRPAGEGLFLTHTVHVIHL